MSDYKLESGEAAQHALVDVAQHCVQLVLLGASAIGQPHAGALCAGEDGADLAQASGHIREGHSDVTVLLRALVERHAASGGNWEHLQELFAWQVDRTRTLAAR